MSSTYFFGPPLASTAGASHASTVAVSNAEALSQARALRVARNTEASQSGRWAFYVGADSPPTHSLQVERPNATGGTGGYYLNQNSPSVTPPQLWNGAWHTVRLHIRHSTTATSNDGVLQVWINGVLKHNESGFSTPRPSAEGGGPDALSGFSFAHNKDDGPPNVDMYLWWGPIRVYTVNPGW